MTAEDMEVLESAEALHSKVVRAVDRMSAIGLERPKERTVRALAAMIVALHWPTVPPEGSSRHSVVAEIKRCFSSVRGRYPAHLPKLSVYPARPSNLPAAIRDHAYGLIDVPEGVEPARFKFELEHAVMRTSNKQIRDSVTPTVQNDSVASSMPMQFMQALQRSLRTFQTYNVCAQRREDISSWAESL